MLFKEKFDLIVSLGSDCACSSYLRRFGLQDYSYPFDWLTKFPFDNRINFLLNDFNDFLNKENLHKIEKPKDKETDSKCDYYEDSKYDIYFFHDFKNFLPFDVAYNDVREKYTRRIKRLYSKISESKKVLFVWWSRELHLDMQHVCNQFNNLQEKFGNTELFLLLIEDKDEKDKQEQYSYLDNHIILIKDYLMGPNKHGSTMGIEETNNLIFKQIRYKSPLKNIIKGSCLNLAKSLVKILIPNRDLRNKIYSKLQYMFLKARL